MSEGSESPARLLPAPPWAGLAAAALLGLLLVSRLAGLTDRPLHHDEGVNAWKTEQMMSEGKWVYDPTNYHGPTLFFIELLPASVTWLLSGAQGSLREGLTETSLRLPIALAGWLMLAGLWHARHHVGWLAALVALLLAGTSPGLLYYSRDFIHETYLLLCTLVTWLALARYQAGGGKGSLLFGSAGLALGFCTKETFAITLGAFAFAVAAAALLGRQPPGTDEGCEEGRFARLRDEARRLWQRTRPHLWDAALLAGMTWYALFSSFLRHLRGPIDSLAAFAPWASTAVSTGHDKPWHWYFTELIGPWEPALAAGGALGLLTALAVRERIGLFLAVWCGSVLAVYSAIPYKTPWLVLNALLPMALLAGWGVEQVAVALRRQSRGLRLALSVLLALGGVTVVGVQAQRARTLAYREYENPSHAYVYVQTRDDVRRLLQRIAFEADPERPEQLAIDVLSPDYWPLPFYLRDYEARFWGTLDGVTIDAPLVIGELRQRADVQQRLGEGWERLSYSLRPGVELDLFFRPEAQPGG